MYGDPNKFKMLPHLTDLVNTLNDNDRAYIGKFIERFNSLVKLDIHDKHHYYIFKLIKEDHLKMIDGFKYDVKIRTLLKNYVITKLKVDVTDGSLNKGGWRCGRKRRLLNNNQNR